VCGHVRGCDMSCAMRDGGFVRALLEERVSRNTSERWEPVYSLAPGLAGRRRLNGERADRTHNTTQPRPRDAKKDTIYDEGEACAAFRAMGGRRRSD
jgi:hypothetical protein